MIYNTISRYHKLSISDEHHRYKSWEHCNNFFRENRSRLDEDKIVDTACLHLAFYLASWGMLRGSGFLLQKDYLVHKYGLSTLI